ncbi:transposase [Thermodesulfovibrio hydrogeniphilus]
MLYLVDGQRRGVYFVTRLKDNASYKVIKSLPVPKNRNIIRDEIIKLKGFYAEQDCPYELRRIEVMDKETKDTVVLLTNQLNFGATTISEIYKDRWQGRFFKTLKQNLRVKTFVGTSANALKIQIWTALIAILILKYLKELSTFGWSLSNLVALLRLNLFTYRNLWEWINKPTETPQIEPQIEQLKFRLV